MKNVGLRYDALCARISSPCISSMWVHGYRRFIPRTIGMKSTVSSGSVRLDASHTRRTTMPQAPPDR